VRCIALFFAIRPRPSSTTATGRGPASNRLPGAPAPRRFA